MGYFKILFSFLYDSQFFQVIVCETAFNSIDKDHRNTIPYEHCFRLILIDAKRKKNLFRSIDIIEIIALVRRVRSILDYFGT